jgi:ribosomal protein L44E
MAEHHTRNTLEVTKYCPQCQQNTQHRVDGGREGPCIDPQHGDPLRTIPGQRQFEVQYISWQTGRIQKKTYERFDDALALYAEIGPDIASLWKTSTTPHQRLR